MERWPVRLSAIVAGLVLAVVATGSWLAFVAIASVDDEAYQRQIRFAERAISELFHGIAKEQESVTIWDDSVIRAQAGDQRWMAENLGQWMATYFGHDAVYVLDPADKPIHAMEHGITLDDAALAWAPQAPVIGPLATALRREIAIASTAEDPSAAIAELVETDYLAIGGVPALVSVRPIVPDTDRLELSPGDEHLHVSVKLLGTRVAHAIAQRYELADARFVLPGEDLPTSAVAIHASSGELLSSLAWEAYRPARRVVEAIAPIIVTAGMAALLLIGWLLRRLWRSTQQLDGLAFHDQVTGLPNRAMFDLRLGRALDMARTAGGTLAVLIADVDRFKHVNDSLGHSIGDMLLRGVGQRIAHVAEEHDATVARFGGDEFALVQSLRDGDEGAAERLAAAIVSAMSLPFDLDGERVYTGVSIGVVMAMSMDGGADDLLRWADIALFEAKARGRGRFEVFAPVLEEIVLRRRTLERDLRIALDNDDELDVAFQPIYDRGGTEILGAEALLRWRHPVHGQLSPAAIVAIAEERGLIDRITTLVLRCVSKLLRGTDFPWIAVNVSAVELRDPAFVERFLAAAAAHEINPHRLQIEITETALIENREVARATLAALRRAGVVVALDDFGTGYSSLNYLRHYEIDKIKIDRSFIERLGISRGDEAILRAIVSMVRALDRRVTAEGVETLQQKEHLVALGCHELQGYFFSAAISGPELLALADHDQVFSDKRA